MNFNIEKVEKRDGRTVEFDKTKISDAIRKAFEANEEGNYDKISERMAEEVISVLYAEGINIPTVEHIQDIVERILMDSGYVDIAKAYILYRAERNRQREKKSKLMKIYNDITFSTAKESDIKRENANVDGDTAMGTMLKYGSEGSKQFYQMFVMNPEHARAHADGDIHIHDMDFAPMGTTTCTQIDLLKLFEKGFSTGHGALRTPNDIASYSALACIAIQSNQNDQHGGQAIVNFDYSMAEGVKKTFKRLYRQNMVKALELLCDISDSKGATKLVKSYIEKNEKESGILPRIENNDKFFEIERVCLKENYGISDEKIEKCQKFAHRKAVEETDRATYQAMEALIHNLNTMHCLPASEKIWIKQGEDVRLHTMEWLDENFKPDTYEVLSIREDGTSVWNYVTASQKKDNNRRIVTLHNKAGQKVTVTDNHRVMTIGDDMTITENMPESIKHTLSPKTVINPPVLNDVNIEEFGKVRKDTPYFESHIVITEQFAELLGIYVGDGSIVSGSDMAISCSHKIQESCLSDLVNASFGKDIEYTVYMNGGEHPEYRFHVGTRVANALKNLCGENAKSKRVPSQILIGSNNLKVAFINGYASCDGRSTTSYQQMSSVSEELRDGIALMIMQLGELPYLSEIKKEGRNTLYSVSLGALACDRIGINTNGEKTVFEIPTYDLSMVREVVTYSESKNEISRRHSGAVRKEELSLFLTSNNGEHTELEKFENMFCSKVESSSIANTEEEYVYDISVANDENFCTAEGVFVHNSRAGAQTPFSSINYGMDTSPEARMVIKDLLLATEAGLGNGETPIFPIQIFRVKEGVNYNEGEPNYDLFKLAIRCSAKRLFPNFSFVDAPFNLQYYKEGHPETEIAYMGCRTRVIGNVVDPEREICNCRGNLSFTTINLPRLAIEAKGDIDKFYKSLDHMMDICVDQLLDRFEFQCRKKVKNFPFLMGQGNWIDSENLDWEDEVREVLKQGTLSVGFIGLAETLKSLIGVHHGESEEARKLGYAIIKHMRDRMDREAEERHLNFSLLATPAEGLCLAGDTLVQTEDGCKPISEVKVGDAVVTLNEETGRFELDTVMASGQTGIRSDIYEVEFDNGQKVVCTSNHPFAVCNSDIGFSWISASEVKQGDMVISGNSINEMAELYSCILSVTKLDVTIPVYDLTMAKNHNFLVGGENGVLVHNSGRFIRIDKQKYGVIDGITNREYYTNSFHVPVYYPISAYEKIDIEAPYHELTNAGHISYIEMDGDPTENLTAFENVIRCMKEKGIGYGSVNHPVDRDPVCGFSGIIKDSCPGCGRKEDDVHFERIRRITGYLVGTLDRFNNAKRAEVEDRVKHNV